MFVCVVCVLSVEFVCCVCVFVECVFGVGVWCVCVGCVCVCVELCVWCMWG